MTIITKGMGAIIKVLLDQNLHLLLVPLNLEQI
jgi:hypothetical protein